MRKREGKLKGMKFLRDVERKRIGTKERKRKEKLSRKRLEGKIGRREKLIKL